MFGAFSRLNYKPWYAIGEFIDNALQSFLDNADRITRSDGKKAALEIRIQIEEDRITISDNAAGIAANEFPRAFLPAAPPPHRHGLSEFGLGMKAAASWFARKWYVRTTALDEPVERTIRFDVEHIIAENIEDLTAEQQNARSGDHRTTIVLEDLHVRPQGRTVGKIKSHLASIYRHFLNTGEVRIYYNDEELSYQAPAVLRAPYFKTPKSPPVEWRKDFEVALDGNHRVWGWAAIRERASLSEAGFAVFRRKRLIQGSFDETYRPEHLFRKPNSFTYQRLFGEMFVDGFQVTHTKDGLQWEEWEEDILIDLKRQLDSFPIALLEQAEGHRQMKARHAVAGFGVGAVQSAAQTVQQHAPQVIESQLAMEPASGQPPETLPETTLQATRTVEFEVAQGDRRWRITIELANDAAQEDWYTYSRSTQAARDQPTEVHIRITLEHPFSERFALHDEEELDPLLRMAAGLVIAEITAREAGAPASVQTIRRNFNQLLREALCNP